MADIFFLEDLQSKLEYEFQDVERLKKALTAPGAEGEKEGDEDERYRYAGNRGLANVGFSLYELCVKENALRASTGMYDFWSLE